MPSYIDLYFRTRSVVLTCLRDGLSSGMAGAAAQLQAVAGFGDALRDVPQAAVMVENFRRPARNLG